MPQNLLHCLYGRSESCSPDGRAPHCISHHREARAKVNALAMSPKSCLHSATRQRTKGSDGVKSKCWTKPNNCSIIQYIGLALRTSGSSHGFQRSCPRALLRENRPDRRTTFQILLCVKFSSEVRPSVMDVRPGAPQWLPFDLIGQRRDPLSTVVPAPLTSSASS